MIFNIALQYQSDPSGNYGGWKATCIGNNWNAAVSMLKQEYKVRPKVQVISCEVDWLQVWCSMAGQHAHFKFLQRIHSQEDETSLQGALDLSIKVAA